MYWIGLTGGIATGKSTVANHIKSMGFKVIDADNVVHQLLKPGQKAYEEVVSHFGPTILNDQRCINRKKLGEIVFTKKDELLNLEKILHPKVQKFVKNKKEEFSKTETIAFYDVPLLFEKNLQSQFDFTIVVSCDVDTQIKRLTKRDKITTEEALDRIQLQLPLIEKKERADYVISNNSGISELIQAVENLVEKISKKLPAP